MSVSWGGHSPASGIQSASWSGTSWKQRSREMLTRSGISYRKTKRAQRVEGFDQDPDFIIPDEFNPQVVIEAKITEDDGTARDKVTRVQHLAAISREGLRPKALPSSRSSRASGAGGSRCGERT